MGTPKTKRETAAALLGELFDGTDQVAIADAVEAGKERGVSRSTLHRAGAQMGVRTVACGPYGGIWERRSNG